MHNFTPDMFGLTGHGMRLRTIRGYDFGEVSSAVQRRSVVVAAVCSASVSGVSMPAAGCQNAHLLQATLCVAVRRIRLINRK